MPTRAGGAPWGTLGRPCGCTNDLGDRNMGVCTADDANPQENTKSTLNRLENEHNHPAPHHISTPLEAIATTSKISLSNQH